MMRPWAGGFAVLLLSLATGPTGVGDTAASVDRYSEADLLRNWALARCLSRAFPGSPLEGDAAAATGGYLERGAVEAEAYAELAKLADQFLSRTYASQSGQPLQTMKCIDLFHSAEVDRVVKRYTKKRGRK
jgi:Type VI secretion system (T6SS), amidase immunity protein